MWIITVFLKENILMYEFDTEKDAREAFDNIPNYKIITEIVYFNKTVKSH